MKTLLLHVPKLEDFYLPFGRYMNVNYLPMGMPAMAWHLDRSGHRTTLVHAGIEKLLDTSWRVVDEVADPDLGAVGLSLHWHYQAHDVARAVAHIREARPDLFVFIGGITASYFGQEVLRTFAGVDAVVQGEGFEPARLLLDALEAGSSLATVPNLIWRQGDEIVANPARMLHDARFVDDLRFADLRAFRNSSEYASQFGFPLAYALEMSREENRSMMTMGRPFFPLFTGSGCSRSCSFCCGNARTQRRINGSHRLLWRSPGSVIADVKRALDAGYRTMALCFDPLPESTAYHVELFRRMRAETPRADVYFECWSLPEPEFVEAFAASFDPPHSYLALSPDTGNDEVRRRNKGYFYSNDQLAEATDLLAERGIQIDVFFSIGLPGENARIALETRDLMGEIAGKYDNIRRLMVWAVQLEPGSPMFEEPRRWGIESNRRTLADFVTAHGGRGDAYTVLGYRIPGYFGDERDRGTIEDFETHFQQFKCMEFCFHSKDPRVYNDPALGRRACLAKRQLLAERRGGPRPTEVVSDGYTHARAVADERPDVERMEV